MNIDIIYPSNHTGKNVLLIDSSVMDSQMFYNSVNDNTFPVLYSSTSLKAELIAVLEGRDIHRIGIVFATGGINLFLDNLSFFSSDNVDFLTSVIRDFRVSNIDYLGCNTLNDPAWTEYYTLIQTTGVIIGASNDRTGNIKYGGDWVMESTSEDIEAIYFTESIEYYKFLLDIGYHTLGIKSDYTIWGTGYNFVGQLGLGDSGSGTNRNTLTKITSDLSGCTPQSIAGGTLYTVVLMTNDTIWGTGHNFFGQLGLGDNTDRTTLTKITSDLSGCTPHSIACGTLYTVVLMTNGTLWSTGKNYVGQLGLGDNTDRTTLTKITSDLSGCTPQSISCGLEHTVVLMTNGTLWSTGGNLVGQLGLGDNTDRNRLTNITSDLSGCTPQSIACGRLHTVVLMTNGTIWGTGYNFYGQLGLGTSGTGTDRTTLTKLTTNNSDFTYISGMTLATPISDICFPAGTPVFTDQGIVSIDCLIPGFHTVNQKPIVDITRTVSLDEHLIQFNKHALGHNFPYDTVIMTKEHMIQYQGKMYAAKTFVANFDVELIPYNGVNLYNILLDEHSTMNINGLICETLHPDNLIAKLYTKQCKLDIATRDKYARELLECLNVKDFEGYHRIAQLC